MEFTKSHQSPLKKLEEMIIVVVANILDAAPGPPWFIMDASGPPWFIMELHFELRRGTDGK